MATIDMPGRSMNVFSDALMDALEKLVDQFEADPAADALVLTSGKGAFIAGADLEMVRSFAEMGRNASRAQLHTTCGRLGRLFVRLEQLTKPTVAAINGLALGGGLEVTMACRFRIAADSPDVQLGLPEIKLGLLPGAGGTQRLPRLIGIEKGLELLLNGKSVGASEAKTLGLVDAVVPSSELIQRAVAMAANAAERLLPPKFPATLNPGPFDFDAPDAVRRITRYFGHDDVTAHYPAYDAIVHGVIRGAGLPLSEGTAVEMDHFVDLMQDDVAGRMISTLFLWRQKAEKQLAGANPVKRFAVRGEGSTADTLRSAIAAAKGTLIQAEEADEGDVVIMVGAGPRRPNELVLLADPEDDCGNNTGIHIARSKAYGSAIEIVTPGAESAGTRAALAVARQLRATPWIHPGSRSLLARLTALQTGSNRPAADSLAALAGAADAMRAAGHTGDEAMADVACVVGGLFPAFAGGPYTWISNNAGFSKNCGSR